MSEKDSITGLSSWETLGQNVARGVESIFSANNFKAAASALSTAFKGVLSGLRTALSELNNSNYFHDIGATIAGMLVGSFSEGGLFNEASKAIGEALTSSLQLLDGFLASMNAVDYSSGLTGWQQFGRGIANAFNNIFTDDNVSSIVGSLDGMATGIVSALEESLGNEEVQTKIKTVMTSLADGIAKIIKSDEVQGVLEEAWGVVVDSLETIIREKHPLIDWAYKTYNTEKTYAALGKASAQTLWGKITGSGTGDTTQSPSETIEQRTQSYMTMSQAEIKAQRAALKEQQEIKKSLETGFYSPFAAGTGFTTKKTTVSTPTTTTGSMTSSLPTALFR